MKDKVEYKTLGEIADVIVGIPEEKNQNEKVFKYYCIQPSHLRDFNQIDEADMVFRGSRVNNFDLVKANDILIKRLSPSNINLLIEATPNTYVSGNMMIIRARENYNPKYVASILESQGLRLYNIIQPEVFGSDLSKAELQNLKILCYARKTKFNRRNLVFKVKKSKGSFKSWPTKRLGIIKLC